MAPTTTSVVASPSFRLTPSEGGARFGGAHRGDQLLAGGDGVPLTVLMTSPGWSLPSDGPPVFTDDTAGEVTTGMFRCFMAAATALDCENEKSAVLAFFVSASDCPGGNSRSFGSTTTSG